ncbi:glutathione peroxidase [Flavobacterium sp. CYK-4]|uniref:glutathione peroxidase n=1 Tax=Flavobacterium lotistagni TaxID=2709660 RepID=UPI0014079278|nr:glutathione peroxidase [Flavobacterium lotistagni]NHM07721.1 glutathione peroxidase [Flavobacterium lotistagni]
MRNLFLVLFGSLLLSCQGQSKKVDPTNNNSNTTKTMEKQNIYQFKVETLSGDTFDFSSLKGKKILVVNTASKCGLTPQYKELEALYKKYKDRNLVIVGFPANNFGQQEPGTNAEISTFCERNYGVTFPMMAKISVKGNDMHPLYQFLTQKAKNGVQDSEVEWNFQKYLINENGELDQVISPQVLPNDSSITSWIEK